MSEAFIAAPQVKDLLAELLDGADARARQPYGLPLPARDTLVHFGSCTANPITPDMLARHEALCDSLAWPDPQAALLAFYGAAQCRLAASGTDAEYSCALAMGTESYCCILMDPNEVGSGCALAAAGLPHAEGCPIDAPLPVRATIETVRLRDASGKVLSQAQVDLQVFEILDKHHHTPVLLHHVACSKTGLTSPSEAACLQVQRDHLPGARVVVDASQGRYQHDDVRRWLSHGWAVIITGSKYFGAPPFCGATLFPPGWPRMQGFASSAGLQARWRLALQAMQATPQPRTHWPKALHEHFMPRLRLARMDEGASPDRQGIFTFELGLNAVQTRQLHRALIADGFFIGQPVAAGSRNLLRVAWGALTPSDGVEARLESLARAIRHELAYG
jgi:hypothetical protein